MSANPRVFRSAMQLSSVELEGIAARDLATPIAHFKGTTPHAIAARDRRALIRAFDAIREEHTYLRSRIDVLERQLHQTRAGKA